MRCEGIAQHVRGADEDVEHTGWQAGFLEQFCDQQTAGDRGIFGRFHNDAVAERNRRGDGADREIEREIPRANDADNAERMPVDAVFLAHFITWQDGAGDVKWQGGGLDETIACGLPFDLSLDARAA